ncbi:hypothetical protein GIB67_015331 [Kingdonia uniflora]|uniref:Casein kinase II subunit beta n=1 Tax=Kingdonia uniflora TaxID=39325 RepID=A0A7J7KYR9_9MAGN|nr:hypothetical protein GIB67_015331 [Kingdonia uniflora]
MSKLYLTFTDTCIPFILYFLLHPAKFFLDYLDIDGAYFGTTFPHLFLMSYGQYKPQKPAQSYVTKIFGFKVHKP